MNDPQDNSNTAIAAVNLGFGYTKLSLDGSEESFMSIVSRQQRSMTSNGDNPNLLNIVHSDGETFEVGMKAAMSSWDEPYRLISSHWGRSRQYRLLSQAVLNRMAFTGKRRWRIITGLAAEHYQDETYREDVANVWRGVGGFHTTAYGVIEVVGVSVVPETVGGFTSLFSVEESRKQIRAHDGVVVDLGTMTTNILPFRSGIPQSDGFQSINVGVFKVMEAATRAVRRRALPSARSVDLESAFLDIRPLSVPKKSASGAVESHQLDVALDVEEAARQIWPQIEVALRTNLDDERGKLLFGIGGGVKVFGKLMEKSFGNSICLLSASAQMENVRGLYLMAKSRSQARS